MVVSTNNCSCLWFRNVMLIATPILKAFIYKMTNCINRLFWYLGNRSEEGNTFLVNGSQEAFTNDSLNSRNLLVWNSRRKLWRWIALNVPWIWNKTNIFVEFKLSFVKAPWQLFTRKILLAKTLALKTKMVYWIFWDPKDRGKNPWTNHWYDHVLLCYWQ